MKHTKLYGVVAKDKSYNGTYLYKCYWTAEQLAKMMSEQLSTEFEVKTYLLND